MPRGAVLSAVAALLAAAACRPSPPAGESPADGTAFDACSDADSAPALAGARCATLAVPLRYGEGRGERSSAGDSVEIFARKFPAEGDARGTVWLLAGGPQSGAMFYPFIETVREAFPGLDVMVPDHRGTGLSTRICPEQEAVDSPGGTRLVGREWADCYRYMRSRPERVRAFSVTHDARDVGELMERMGRDGPRYLFGTSYGTLVGLRFLQAEVADLDGVVLGSSMALVSDTTWAETRKARVADAAGHQLLARCDADAGCRELLGGNALERYRSVLGAEEAGELELPGVLPGGDLRAFLGRLLNFPDAREWIPGLVASLAEGDTARLAAAVRALRERGPVVDFPAASLSVPKANTVFTSERVVRSDLSPGALDRAFAELEFVDRLPYRLAAGIEAELPTYEPGRHHGTLPDTVPPTLVLHGTLDARTPFDGARTLVAALDEVGPVGLVGVHDAPHYLVAYAPECFTRHVRDFVTGGEPRDRWCGEESVRLDFDEELPAGEEETSP